MSGELRGMLILTENRPLVPSGDLGALVDMAVTAEQAGMHSVMLSDHVCLGPEAGERGRPANPREYAAPGNQDPAMDWPSPIVMASAIAAATSRVRIALAALITPLRNPVVLAKDLATLDRLSGGRLVVQPTVSWSRQEYAALGLPFSRRGALLDDGLAAMKKLWADAPATHRGPIFSFGDVYCRPSPLQPWGPPLWFGGRSLHPALLRRLVTHGSGFHPFGTPAAEDLGVIRAALTRAGRPPDDLEMIGGTRAVFTGSEDVADLDRAMADFPRQVEAGFTTFCMKPAQHTDRIDEVGDLCRAMVEHLNRLS